METATGKSPCKYWLTHHRNSEGQSLFCPPDAINPHPINKNQNRKRRLRLLPADETTSLILALCEISLAQQFDLCQQSATCSKPVNTEEQSSSKVNSNQLASSSSIAVQRLDTANQAAISLSYPSDLSHRMIDSEEMARKISTNRVMDSGDLVREITNRVALDIRERTDRRSRFLQRLRRDFECFPISLPIHWRHDWIPNGNLREFRSSIDRFLRTEPVRVDVGDGADVGGGTADDDVGPGDDDDDDDAGGGTADDDNHTKTQQRRHLALQNKKKDKKKEETNKKNKANIIKLLIRMMAIVAENGQLVVAENGQLVVAENGQLVVAERANENGKQKKEIDDGTVIVDAQHIALSQAQQDIVLPIKESQKRYTAVEIEITLKDCVGELLRTLPYLSASSYHSSRTSCQKPQLSTKEPKIRIYVVVSVGSLGLAGWWRFGWSGGGGNV